MNSSSSSVFPLFDVLVVAPDTQALKQHWQHPVWGVPSPS